MIVYVVGAGVWGMTIARKLSRIKGVHVGGMVDPARAYGVDAFGDPVLESLAGVLDNMRPDAIVVATPPSTHAEIVRECCDAGVKRIRVEKPMGVSDVDARLMHHYAAVCGVGLTVGYQMLHSYGWSVVREWAASRDIKRFAAIRTTSGQPRHDVTAMLDMGSHAAAYATQLNVSDVKIETGYGSYDVRSTRLESVDGEHASLVEVGNRQIVELGDTRITVEDDDPLMTSLQAWVRGFGYTSDTAMRAHKILDAQNVRGAA